MFKRFLKEYFTFTKSERNGTLVLVFLIVLVLAGYFLLPEFITSSETNFTEFEEQIEAFKQSQDKLKTDSIFNLKTSSEPIAKKSHIELFEFDPNDLSYEKWKQLGLSDKVINTIKKYVRKGGRFTKPDDLKKIYGLKNDWYVRAKPYIRIRKAENSVAAKTSAAGNYNNKESSIVELNSADSLSLIELQGIGPVFAGRIIKYRNLLGGFISNDQLLEVYGFPNETFDLISQVISIDTNFITKIDLNQAGYPVLIRHPYLDEYMVEGIINYREIKGRIQDINELITNRIIPEKTFNRIKPYLVVTVEKSN